MERSLKGDQFVSAQLSWRRVLSSLVSVQTHPHHLNTPRLSPRPSLQKHPAAFLVSQALVSLVLPRRSSWQRVHSISKPGSIPVCIYPFSNSSSADMTAFHLSSYRNISVSVPIRISLAISLLRWIPYLFLFSPDQLRSFLLSA